MSVRSVGAGARDVTVLRTVFNLGSLGYGSLHEF